MNKDRQSEIKFIERVCKTTGLDLDELEELMMSGASNPLAAPEARTMAATMMAMLRAEYEAERIGKEL